MVSTRNLLQLKEQIMGQKPSERAAEQQLGEEMREASPKGSAARSRPDLPSAYLAPRSKLEGQIVTVWQELLGIQPIGVYDSFFDLGGDSLLAIQLAVRLNEALATNLSVQDLFDAPQVAGLAEIITITSLAAQALPSTQGAMTVEREEIEL
jgi:acyl carrier protein